MRKPHLAVLAAAIAVLLALAACGDKATPAPPSKTSATLQEWSIRLDEAVVRAGDVTFDASNKGTIEHEFVVIRTGLAPGSLAVTAEGKADEAAAGTTIGEIEPDELGPSQSASATFNLPAGKYVLICNIPGHYQQGMYTGLTAE